MGKDDITIVKPEYERAALALAMGASVGDIAQSFGVNISTVNRWLMDKRFAHALEKHVNTRIPATFARMRARLGSSLPEILDSHAARAASGDTASARIVLAIWRALEELGHSRVADGRISDADISTARAGEYDVVEGEVVEVSVDVREEIEVRVEE